MTPVLGLFRDALRADLRLAFWVTVLRVGEAVLSPLSAVALGGLVDAAVGRNPDAVAAWAILFAVGDAGSSALSHPAGKLQLTLREKTNFLFAQRLLRLSTGCVTLERLERPDYQDLLELTRDRSSSLGDLIVQAISIVQAFVMMVIVLGALISVHPVLMALVAAAVPTVFLAGRSEATRHRRDEFRVTALRLTDRLFEIATRAESAKEVKVSGAEAALRSRFNGAYGDARRILDGTELRAVALTAAGWLLFGASFMAAIAFVVNQAALGNASPGQAVLVLALAIRINEQVDDLTGAMSGARRTILNVRRFHSLYQSGRLAVEEHRESLPLVHRSSPGAIELRELTFRYPEGDRDVLHGISLRLEPGTTVAIVGDNGAGKTTLIKLLCGLYAPTGGRILVDGLDLANIGMESWYRRLSGCFQDFVRFELLLRESVGLGLIERLYDTDLIWKALDRGGAVAMAESLPKKLDTQLGARWNKGVDLSGGQWQKVALARAMMRPYPHLLVLDEPTASLDVASEHVLYDKFSRARDFGIRTSAITVLVSHRLATVRLADAIVLLEDGTVKAMGSHQMLMQVDGGYAQMYELQASGYRQTQKGGCDGRR